MEFLNKIFGKQETPLLSKDELAELLKVSPQAMEAFENSYRIHAIDDEEEGQIINNAKKAVKNANIKYLVADGDILAKMDKLVDIIVDELIAQTRVFSYTQSGEEDVKTFYKDLSSVITLDDLMKIPESVRPQVSGNYTTVDIKERSAEALFFYYKKWQEEKDTKKKYQYYARFRQGLEILDLDPILYETLSKSPDSIGNWLPELAEGVRKQNFFKIPSTKFLKVPLTLLQLSRIEYESLNPVTKRILNRYCTVAFDLDESKSYHIKTGVFSSKFDFRNAKVSSPQEIKELGEYLLYITYQAVRMAEPLNNIVMFGAATTNEWVVREFIEDVEGNPCIYKGLPLHTEYRFFIDFDTDEVIGVSPYWEPETMKKRFNHANDSDSPHNLHDYIIFKAHEEEMMERYQSNVGKLKENVEKMLPDIPLHGQYSMDIMQNGDDFYIIDMATAHSSALKECVPKEKLKANQEDWLPRIERRKHDI